MGRRVAIMRVSGEVLRSLLPPGEVIDLQADTIQRTKDAARHSHRAQDLEWLRRALLLPDNCRVDDVIPHFAFATDEYGLRLECDDFAESRTGLVMPEVRAEYVVGPDGKARFSHWAGAGVRAGYFWKSGPTDGPSVLGKVYETFDTAEVIDEARRVRFREWL